ncbi:GTPase Era [Mycoplasmoides genitalium]|uniref:GTPase Era n=2 Tax=Mycoplasmoides genitalium TaxID=2097 RepID=ERA_MYCGE|nr:GTPase Era [Mycoplasmoides genitalium]P47627.1 RecName: Full=GTPase Era [Mycoplasmoides genitalium G37]ABY79503.1 GTP-binding protein Era [synthetic Mycoplasma genitalium JCVI-1.0]AAC71614.1 GTP-binding protein Era [Mycoplasmoides genitalium G37]AFQ04222.1 GTP-binding protein Era [Mycoplasmoides genitalium M6320]AFQ04726.1 GTP-binding protein Era [Mycoplasmoides genitalium M2288]
MKVLKVGVLGPTNAGKSTLINFLHNDDSLMVSSMNNTTLLSISTEVINQANKNIVFIDVPGFTEKKHSNYELITKEIRKALSGIDVLLLVVRSDQNNKIEFLKTQLQQLKRYQNLTRIFLINKFHQKSLSEVNKAIILEEFKPQKTIEINLLKFDKNLFWSIFKQVELRYNIFRKDINFIDANNDDFKILEGLREQIIFYCKNEIPHIARIEIIEKSFNKEKNLLKIHLVISVPKLSQKKIIIGKNAEMIKAIGIATRKKLLNHFDCDIFIDIFVKTEKQKLPVYSFLSK